MKSNKKSFYFQDYTESELIYNSRSNDIKISLNRVTFLSFIFFSLIIIFSIKIIYLSLSAENFIYNSNEKNLENTRRDIIDRNNSILATNVTLFNVGVRPGLLSKKEKKNLLIKLGILFPELDLKEIRKKLSKKNYFSIGKRLTPKERDQFWLMGNKAFVFDPVPSRIYPQKNLFSHVLGQTNNANKGISGIEKSLDLNLNNLGKINTPLALTLDSNLQYLIRKELVNAKQHFNHKGSGAILMDVETGEILSLISLPDYDLNKRVLINEKIFANKITLDVYEFGSVFKTFTIAAGLENKVINQDTIFKNLDHSITCDKHKISEYAKLPKDLSVEQILVRSSNIGSVRIAQKIGIEKYKKFLNTLGIFEKINFDLEEIGKPLSFNWGKCKLATASFGRGITTTALQIARSYAILSNGGYEIQPFIFKDKKKIYKERKKVISTSTSNAINSMLRKVVSLNEGTANFANIEGYEVGGKTGTSVKYRNNAKLNTFVSLFPSSKPKYVLLVMLDEPKPAPSYIYNMPATEDYPNGYEYKGETRNTSGWNTVVVAGKIIEKIGPILAINSLEASKNF